MEYKRYENQIRVPGPNQSVYREDCTQCFGSIDDPTGLDVCLSCFNGGCVKHAPLHYQSSSHPLAVNIKRTRKQVKRDEPPAKKISKIAIAAETEQDRYDTKTSVRCYVDGQTDIDASEGKLQEVVSKVLKATTFARQAEVQAWEAEITACEHTLCLEQSPPRSIASQDLGQCSMCDLRENLWLCLECGNLACGRAQFGGTAGNGHALAHGDSQGHPVAVKLGSLTPEGTADIYCYKCNDERIDPELASHLAHWGVNIAEREKTEQSLTEQNVEQNLKWDFSMMTEDGKELTPLFGKGLTGLKNLGNSCYLASATQCLFALPAFQNRYFLPNEAPPHTPDPAFDLETQLRKVADGLLSGTYSVPDPDTTASDRSPEVTHQRGLMPSMLKHLIGKGHEEFSTMRQQDAFELLLHLFKLISRSSHPSPSQDPTRSFRFLLEQRLQCRSCKRVRYQTDEQDNISVPVPARRLPKAELKDPSSDKDDFEPVTLEECLSIFTDQEAVEFTCPGCNSKEGAIKQSLFKTFPQVLAINTRRFELVNWVPTKLDIPVVVSDQAFDLDRFFSKGKQEDEELLPENVTGSAPSFVPNEAAIGQLLGMGFPQVRSEKALHATGNSDAEAAMNWLFAHMEDPDIDTPLDLGESSANPATGPGAVSEESIQMLVAMGIGVPQARKGLKETNGDIERAIDWVFSHPDDQGDFDDGAATEIQMSEENKETPGSADLPARFRLSSIICHKGASVHSGHYVAFIRKEIGHGQEEWVLFNDEKVVKAHDVEEMKKFAYIYFFERAT